MLSAKECLAKAASMPWEADHCEAPKPRADLTAMAMTWRQIARQALWQDRFNETWPARAKPVHDTARKPTYT